MNARRRSVLRAGFGLGLATAGIAGCSTAEYGGPHRTVRLAAGENGGFYMEFAQLLAEQLRRAEPALTPRVRETLGSVENLELVRTERVEFGLALSDVAASAFAGRDPFPEPLPIRAIGRVYENYTQLVVLAESGIHTVDDLSGRRVSFGADGSGAAVLGDRLLAATGLAAEVEHRPLAEAIADLEVGRLDALLWSGGVPTPALAELADRRPIRLIRLAEQLALLRAEYGASYQQVPVPEEAYRGSVPVDTIGVPNLLVCHRNLPDELARAVTTVLVRRAPRLVPGQALGTQYLDQRSLIATGEVSIHPGAAATYRELRG